VQHADDDGRAADMPAKVPGELSKMVHRTKRKTTVPE
jgi:hypothetical protein